MLSARTRLAFTRFSFSSLQEGVSTDVATFYASLPSVKLASLADVKDLLHGVKDRAPDTESQC